MVTNKLIINADKTHLDVMGSKKMETNRTMVELQAGEHIIYPYLSESEKLLRWAAISTRTPNGRLISRLLRAPSQSS